MFRTHGRGASLPAPEELRRLRLQAIARENPITAGLVAPLHMPEIMRRRLARAWDTMKDPGGSLNAFDIEVEAHQSRQGHVTLIARYENGTVRPGVELVNYIENARDDEDDIDVKRIYADEASEEGRSAAWWRWLWERFEPVGTLHAGPRVGPNDPCPCGSGRKAKKCCG